MNIFAALYFASSLIGLFMTVPQIRRLLITKRSDELSVGSWLTWSLNQFAMMIYMYSLGELVAIITSTLWMGFYVVMLGLIVYYRKHPGDAQPALVTIEE